MRSQERNSAGERLEAAVVEQDRVNGLFDAAVGTSTEFGAYVHLRAAGQQVRAREAWVHWVDDEGYRGLNAGPFELLAESSGPAPDSSAGERVSQLMKTQERNRAAGRRGELHRAQGDRRVGHANKARRDLPTTRGGGRGWQNGREGGGIDPRFSHLAVRHD